MLKQLESSLEISGQKEVVTKCLENWAELNGDQTLIYYGEMDKNYTYQEFNELANSVAHSLLLRGVSKGDRVSVFLKNPLITTIAMFGIWKCGAIFCPINFNYRGNLLSYQLNDTEPKMLITERSMVPILNDIVSDISGMETAVYSPKEGDHDFLVETSEIRLDPVFHEFSFERLFNGDKYNPSIELDYRDTANIIYTSGTTGPAKGVVQSHRWINGYTIRLRLLMTQDDVIYNDLPLYHVGGAFANVARAVYVGCAVALWDKFSPSQFWNRINKSGASSTILLDVMIPWLMNAKPSAEDRNNTLNKVHMQPLPTSHHDVAKRFGFNYVTSGFGQTETGNPLAGIIIELEEDEGAPEHLVKGLSLKEIIARCEKNKLPFIDGKKDSIKKGFMGKPSDCFEVAILDENDEQLPVGQVGQLALRSRFPNLILSEYFKKPESTVKAFRNLWFHTGDAGYMDEDGYYYFIDRLGGVIRCRGEKFSSYQLEDTINNHPNIDLCAAFPIPATEGDEDDVAIYVVRKNGEGLSEVELQEWIKDKLPKYMWPKYIRFTTDIPRTPTNKMEKYKLQKELMSELKNC